MKEKSNNWIDNAMNEILQQQENKTIQEIKKLINSAQSENKSNTEIVAIAKKLDNILAKTKKKRFEITLMTLGALSELEQSLNVLVGNQTSISDKWIEGLSCEEPYKKHLQEYLAKKGNSTDLTK